VLGGGYGFVKTGAGTLTLAGASANTYSGTTIDGGVLKLANSATLGAISGVLKIRNGATLDLGGTVQSIGACGASGAGNGLVGKITGGTLNIQANNMYLQSGTLSADLTSTAGSNGRLWIGGDPNATVYLDDVNNVQFSDASSTIIGYSTTGAAGTVKLLKTTGLGPASQRAQFFSGTIDFNGRNATVGSVLLAGGTACSLVNNSTSSPVTYAGNVLLRHDSAGLSANIGGAGDLNLSGMLINESGTATYDAGVTKVGAGKLTLSGANTYTGLTTVTGGTLALVDSSADWLGAFAPVLAGGGAAIGGGMLTLDYTDGADPASAIRLLVGAQINALSGYNPPAVLDNTAVHVVTLVNTISGDADLNATVNGADLNIVLSNYNKTGQYWYQGDFDRNGTVNGADLNTVLSNYNQHLSSVASAVPEPSTVLLLATGLVGLMACAWRKLQ
jgi:autotransporter-associated beta strand protein